MANFKAVVTKQGIDAMTRFLSLDKNLPLVRAEAGNGRTNIPKNEVTALAQPIQVEINMGQKVFVDSKPSYMKIPVHINNKGLGSAVYIRELGIYALDEEGREFLFSYSWLDGEDTDNMIPACPSPLEADTVHIHDVAVFVTDSMNGKIEVLVGSGAFVTVPQMEEYALKRPFLDGREGQFLRKGKTEAEWADMEIPPDFDNPFCWVGCTRLTEDNGNGSYTEKIVTTAGNKLKAQRVTTRNGENDMTEAYTFYGEDGRTVQASYTVRTTKDSSGAVWREAIEEVQA